MPIVVFALSLAVFAQGTSEFMLSGLIESVAADTGVSLSAAAWLTSLFAVGMIAGAPVMAMTASRWQPRGSLVGFLACFIVAHVVGAVTTSFGVLLFTRLIAAVANAGFLAVALAALPRLAGSERVGRATSIILSGVTVACIVGVPAGAMLGQMWGWRSAFLAVAVVSLPALIATWALVPMTCAPRRSASVMAEWRTVRSPLVGSWLVLGATVNAATFASFTYLAVTVTQVSGGGEGGVPVVLAVFGIGSFIGVTIGGRVADRRPHAVIAIGASVLLLLWLVAAVTAPVFGAVVVMALLCGAVSFAVGSTLIGAIVRSAAPDAPTLSGAFATMAFNIGAAAGPAVAGLMIGVSGSYIAPMWTSAALVATALLVAAYANWRWSLLRHSEVEVRTAR